MQIEKIIYKCSKGDKRAQKKIFDLYADRLFAVAMRYNSTVESTEEALSQAFVKIFEKLPVFNFINEEALTGWLTKIVVNQSLMNRRKEIHTLYKLETIDDEHFNAQNIDKTGYEAIIEMVSQLPEGYKTVFLMYVVEGYSHKEIAETLGISEGTSRSQFFKARKLLQKRLNYEYGQSGT